MPNYYAHLEFGRRVLDTLPLPLRKSVEAEKDAFFIGLYGPDPLFFSPRRRVRQQGLDLHRQAVRPVAARLRQAMEEHLPMAHGYAAGFLCHFALDSACHPYVDAMVGRGEATHGQIEAELDRLLMLRVGLDPMEDTPMPPIAVTPELEPILRAAYPGLSPRQFQQGYDLFGRISRLLTVASGAGLRGLVDRLAQRHAICAPLHGIVLTREPDPVCEQSSADLYALLTDTVSPTVEALSAYFAGAELDEWYCRDFHATPVGEEAASMVPAPAPSV